MFETFIDKGAEPAKWILVAAIAYSLAGTIWSFVAAPASTTASALSVSAPPASDQRAPVNVNWVLSKHLFGQAGAAPQAIAESDRPAVETRLPLELKSVFVSDQADASAAIVTQRNKPSILYTIGDTLPGNAKLVAVLTDRIILLRAGTREALMFPKFQSELTATPTPTNAGRKTAGSAKGKPGTTKPQQETKPDPLREYQEKFAQDAQGALNELGVAAVSGDQSQGYRIDDVSQSAYLSRSGLQTGDVILSVNGRQVGNLQQDKLELANIVAQGSARIEVRRGSRRFFITASLK